MKNWYNLILIAVAAASGYLLAIKDIDDNQYDHFEKIIANATLIDLSHRLEQGMPTGPGPNMETIETLLSHTPGEGLMEGSGLIHRYSFPGQWGTHVDAPVHFIKGKRTLEDIPLTEMVLPLIILDIHQQVSQNPDYQISMADVIEWEKENGKIPEKSFVALRSDWSKRWPFTNELRNWDQEGNSHSPAWSKDVLEFLANSRNITAIGHETMDTDLGRLAASGQYPLETYFLGLDKYQIENMKSLDQVPKTGSFIIASWVNSKGGAGFPARVFAIVPQKK